MFKTLIRCLIRKGLQNDRIHRELTRAMLSEARLLKHHEGLEILLDANEYIGHAIFRGTYAEKQRLKTVLDFLGTHAPMPDDAVWMDIGANIGTHTLYAAQLGTFSHFVCVEADPKNFDTLSKNLILNGLSDAARAHCIAAGSQRGSAILHRLPGNAGASTLNTGSEPEFNRREAQDSAELSVSVEVTRIDDLLAAEAIAPETIGLIWMDIEGFEFEAMRGMDHILSQGIPIQFEFTRERYTDDQITQMTNLLGTHYTHIYTCGETISEIHFDALPDLPALSDLLVLRQ